MNLTIENIRRLLVTLKSYIHDDFRCTDEPDDETPSMVVVIATKDGKTWSYQTGDTSYFGTCYFYRHWSVIWLFRDSNCRSLAREAVRELKDKVADEKEYARN